MQAYAHLSYDLNNYASSLKRTANLAGAFFIKDTYIRMRYQKEIDDVINAINFDFRNTHDPREKSRFVQEMRAEYESAEREYQKLRTNDYSKYVITNIFEEQGIIKYAKITTGVITGGLQAFAGLMVMKSGRIIPSNRVKSLGIILVAHGGNNIYESVAPVFLDNFHIGPVRKVYHGIAHAFGKDNNIGNLAYSTIDFFASSYGTYGTVRFINNRRRMIAPGIFDTAPGTGRLFNNLREEMKRSWEMTAKPLLTLQATGSGYKGYLLYENIKEQF